MSKYKSSEFLKAVRGASFKILAGGTAGTHTHTHTHTHILLCCYRDV